MNERERNPTENASAVSTTPQAAPAPRAARDFTALPLALTIAFLGFLLVPPISTKTSLTWAFAGTGAFLLLWYAILWIRSRRGGPRFVLEPVKPLPSHYIQSTVQICVYVYWGWYWRDVYAEVPQFLGQLFFLYAFDAMLAWSRGHGWRFGFGPLPIILSTNIFIWFRDDWYVFQFLLVATGALGKELIRWTKEGRRTHIFNPSAFPLSLVSIVLLVTGTTEYTRGIEIATTIQRPPHIYLEIFLLGLVVQYLFSVTWVTLAAASTMMAMNVVYTAATGTYYFIDTYIATASFLGLHLLVTDPATSPRTPVGKLIFGVGYGVAIWCLYGILGDLDVPQFYDKLLPIPILNLCIQLFDRIARSGFLGNVTRAIERIGARRANLVAMGAWGALFGAMLLYDAVDAPHPGANVAFWKKSMDEGKHLAKEKMLKVLQTKAGKGSGAAFNALGVIYSEGKIVPQDRKAAAHCFARACDLGTTFGCYNVARLYIRFSVSESPEAVERAFLHIEAECAKGTDGECFYLLGLAHASGLGRPIDVKRAEALYAEGCRRGNAEACKALAEIRAPILPR